VVPPVSNCAAHREIHSDFVDPTPKPTIVAFWVEVWINALFCRIIFAISLLIQRRNLKILVSTPDNALVIMWDRDKNIQLLMLYELRNRGNKKYARDIFAATPFIYVSC
jgi:hypothetical protein